MILYYIEPVGFNMLSMKNENNKIEIYDYDKCVFSSCESRPSKSLIDCGKYKEYQKLNLNLDILNEFSYLNIQTKSLEYFLLRELISVFKLSEVNISLSFDTIIINESELNLNKSNLIFCLEHEPTIKNIIINLHQLIKEMKSDDVLIINFINLFTYPSAELLILILNMFQKVKLYYCKIIKQPILYCINYKHNSNITIFIRNILNKWKNKSNIRQFGIYINPEILDLLKIHNDIIFEYYFNINKNIAYSTLEDKEFFFKHYSKKYLKVNSGFKTTTFDCNHNIKEFNLQNCHICVNCYELFSIH